MKIGSQEHQELFCQTFMASHRQYDPDTLPWPDLDDASLARLQGIPFWGEAIRIERKAGLMVSTFAETVSNPRIREAIALQGREEARHARLLECMTQRYGIETTVPPTEALPLNIEPAFVKFGYGECIDSFFAFGLFEIGRQSGFFPASLLAIFDPVLDEEARHIVFFVNWIAYLQAIQGRGAPPLRATLTMWHYGRALLNLVHLLRSADTGGAGFTATGASVVDMNLTPEKFLSTCLRENARRMSVFDERLLRPQLLPSLGKISLSALKLLPQRQSRTQNISHFTGSRQ
ncbi:MAG: ferritin-like domain-containing protein [Leptolyngbyaceae bacterium]|nr:ferritin-like domain-containing protein [Leptolyngbyaceae bacterium]